MIVILRKTPGGYTCQDHSSTRQDANDGVFVLLAMGAVSKGPQTPVQAACTTPVGQTLWELSAVSDSTTATACTVRPCRLFFFTPIVAS